MQVSVRSSLLENLFTTGSTAQRETAVGAGFFLFEQASATGASPDFGAALHAANASLNFKTSAALPVSFSPAQQQESLSAAVEVMPAAATAANDAEVASPLSGSSDEVRARRNDNGSLADRLSAQTWLVSESTSVGTVEPVLENPAAAGEVLNDEDFVLPVPRVKAKEIPRSLFESWNANLSSPPAIPLPFTLPDDLGAALPDTGIEPASASQAIPGERTADVPAVSSSLNDQTFSNSPLSRYVLHPAFGRDQLSLSSRLNSALINPGDAAREAAGADTKAGALPEWNASSSVADQPAGQSFEQPVGQGSQGTVNDTPALSTTPAASAAGVFDGIEGSTAQSMSKSRGSSEMLPASTDVPNVSARLAEGFAAGQFDSLAESNPQVEFTRLKPEQQQTSQSDILSDSQGSDILSQRTEEPAQKFAAEQQPVRPETVLQQQIPAAAVPPAVLERSVAVESARELRAPSVRSEQAGQPTAVSIEPVTASDGDVIAPSVEQFDEEILIGDVDRSDRKSAPRRTDGESVILSASREAQTAIRDGIATQDPPGTLERKTVDQIVSHTVVESRHIAHGDSERFHIRLDPPDLGGLTIEIQRDSAGQVSVHLTAASSETHLLLENNTHEIAQALQDQGLQLTQFDLSHHQQQGQSADQFREHQDQLENSRLVREAQQQFPSSTSHVVDPHPDRLSFRA